MSTDARDIARKYITDQAKEADYGDIGDVLISEASKLPQAEFDKLRDDVDDLIGKATVLVIFPGDEYANAVALLLRDFADMIDRGPDVPLPPSVYSALVRERADNLAGQAESEASA
jgi:hypothetical protein